MPDDPTGAAAVAPEAPPAPSPAPEPISTPDPAPDPSTEPKPGKSPIQTAREAMRQVTERFTARKAEAGARDDKGRFRKADEPQEPEAPEKPATEPPADPEAPGKEADPTPAAEVAEGQVRIDLPDGHPLRDQGREFIDVAKDQEETSRALVNSWTRRSDVDRANAARQEAAKEATQLRRQVARLTAEAELRSSGELDKFVDPELLKMLDDAEKYDPERAKILRDAIEAKKNEIINAKGYEAERAAQDQETGAEFLSGLWDNAPTHYAVWFNQGQETFRAAVAPIIGAYGRHIDQRMANGGQGPNVAEFFREWVDPQYARDPGVVTAVKNYRQQEQDRIRQQGVAEGRQAAEKAQQEQRREAAGRHGRRPPSAPASTQRQGRAADDPEDPIRDAPPGQRQRVMRNLARKAGQAFSR